MSVTLDTNVERILTRKLAEAQARVYSLEGEVDTLTAQLKNDGVPPSTQWLQTKGWRQRTALRRLNQRVVAQRLTLRFVIANGHYPSREEIHEYVGHLPMEEREAIWDLVAEKD